MKQQKKKESRDEKHIDETNACSATVIEIDSEGLVRGHKIGNKHINISCVKDTPFMIHVHP